MGSTTLRIAPWSLLGALVLFTTGAAAFAISEHAHGSINSPKIPESKLLTLHDVERGWGTGHPWSWTTRQTWSEGSCSSHSSTSVGVPVVRTSLNSSSPNTIDEAIMQPTGGSQALLDEMIKCGLPPDLLSDARGGSPVPKIVSHRISLGVGQRSVAAVSVAAATLEVPEPIPVTSAIIAQGPYLIFFIYHGTAGQAQVRQWAEDAVKKAQQ
jgi:hypothetical protein